MKEPVAVLMWIKPEHGVRNTPATFVEFAQMTGTPLGFEPGGIGRKQKRFRRTLRCRRPGKVCGRLETQRWAGPEGGARVNAPLGFPC
jgi:hypothetical protein